MKPVFKGPWGGKTNAESDPSILDQGPGYCSDP